MLFLIQIHFHHIFQVCCKGPLCKYLPIHSSIQSFIPPPNLCFCTPSICYLGDREESSALHFKSLWFEGGTGSQGVGVRGTNLAQELLIKCLPTFACYVPSALQHIETEGPSEKGVAAGSAVRRSFWAEKTLL